MKYTTSGRVEVEPLTICIQCAMKDFIEGRAYRGHDETEAEHYRRVHPDPEVTQRERVELERLAAEKIARDGLLL